MTLKAKLTLQSAAITLMVAVAVLFMVRYMDRAVEQSDARATLDEVMSELDEDDLSVSDGELQYRGSGEIPVQVDGVYLQVYDREGNLVSGTDLTGGVLTNNVSGFQMLSSGGGGKAYVSGITVTEEPSHRRGDASDEPGGEFDASDEMMFDDMLWDDGLWWAADYAADAASGEILFASASDEMAYMAAASGEASGEISADDESASLTPVLTDEKVSAADTDSSALTDASASVEPARSSDDTVSAGDEAAVLSDEQIASADASSELSDTSASDEPSSGNNQPAKFYVYGVIPAGQSGSLFHIAIILLPILVLLAALSGWAMSFSSLRPIRRIADASADISDGNDLSRRIDIGPGHDEVHKLADTMNGMLSRLEHSFLTERQFTSDASHELRTPTAVILAECDTAKKTASTPEEYCEAIDAIERQGRKMAGLISKLLSYTRRELGTETAHMEEVDLTDLCEAVCDEQAMLATKGITVTDDLQPGVTVQADMELLLTVIQNLVSNACKYGRENGHVRVTLRSAGSGAVLSVKDDGIGIPADKLGRVFDRFFQVDPARTNADGGLGLGLSMAQQIAHMHGGEITAESTQGEGSTFTLRLPGKDE